MDNEIIFVAHLMPMCDVDLFCQGWSETALHATQARLGDKFIFDKSCANNDNIVFQIFRDGDVMAHLMQRAGLFPSVSIARKNGWNKPIPPGFSQHVVGKKRLTITILNDW